MFSSEKPHLSHPGKWVRSLVQQLRATCSGVRRTTTTASGVKPGGRRPPTSGDGESCLPSSFAAMEVSTQLKHVFRAIDADGDGKISPLELGEVLLSLGHEAATAAAEAEGMVREVDRDGDGLIDLEEFMGVVDGARPGDEGEEDDLVAAFRLFDADGNGFISAEELRRVMVGLGHRDCTLHDCSRMIGGVDRNGDGLVDLHEFLSMMMSRPPPTLT
uniref:Putative calcium-binding protein CML10 n=1 Tax=Anthurium amnicola TaxID=1678845 RepID=A0A1D1YYZ7_9ARAE